MMNIKPSEKLGVIATIDPQTVVGTEVFSDVVDMSNIEQVLAIASIGDMAAVAINFKAYTCDAAGSNAVVLKSATELAASATLNDNKQILINVRNNDLMAVNREDGTKSYIKFGIVSGATGGDMSVVVLSASSLSFPSTQLDSVVEIVG